VSRLFWLSLLLLVASVRLDVLIAASNTGAQTLADNDMRAG